MRWKTKARIQNVVSLIPSSISYALYYWIQRNIGGLRKVNPERKLEAAVETWNLIRKSGHDPRGKVFLEVGTGRVPNIPISFWLMGARRTITIDLNPYMKAELIVEMLEYIKEYKERIQQVYGSLLDESRFNELLSWATRDCFCLSSFLEFCHIQYVSPGDAAMTNLPDHSIDFHTSRAVFEHIPPSILVAIVKEGNRIVRDGGLFVHQIDYSDHFSHSDKSISSINFLQYSDSEWARYAGNRYMYMNRLRHDDVLLMLESLGHRILITEPKTDPRALALLRSGVIEVDGKFRDKAMDVLSISGSWIVSQFNSSSDAYTEQAAD